MAFQILLFFQFYVFQPIFMDVSLLKNLQTRKPVPMYSETDFFWTLQDLPSLPLPSPFNLSIRPALGSAGRGNFR